MSTLKYSRQRESIKNFLAGRKDHPTAETIYSSLRQEQPRISLGTVYRNLSLLTELGRYERFLQMTARIILMEIFHSTIILFAGSAIRSVICTWKTLTIFWIRLKRIFRVRLKDMWQTFTDYVKNAKKQETGLDRRRKTW